MSQLPARPDLDQLRRQARELHQAARDGNPRSLRRLGQAPAAVRGIRTVAAPMSLAASSRPPGGAWSSRRPRSTRLLVVAFTAANVRRGVTRLTMVPRA